MKLSIIIPVFNEKNTIAQLLEKVERVDLNQLSFDKQIIVVDDCSADGTREVLDKMADRYKIIYHARNQGKGMAIRTGLQYAEGDYIIIQDADLEYDPEDYKTILKCALENKADIVYGSRILSHKNKFSYSSYYYGGILLNWLTNFICGIKITDESTCYKFFRADVLKSFNLECQRFEFCPEVTAKAAKRKIKIYEVPISYYPRSHEEGKKIKWKDGLQALWTLVKYRFFK